MAGLPAPSASTRLASAEERNFRSDLFGTGGPRRPRRKGPPKADAFFKKLPKVFTIDQVRKLAGRATGVSLAQWARAKKVKKTASGYEKVAA